MPAAGPLLLGFDGSGRVSGPGEDSRVVCFVSPDIRRQLLPVPSVTCLRLKWREDQPGSLSARRDREYLSLDRRATLDAACHAHAFVFKVTRLAVVGNKGSSSKSGPKLE